MGRDLGGGGIRRDQDGGGIRMEEGSGCKRDQLAEIRSVEVE